MHQGRYNLADRSGSARTQGLGRVFAFDRDVPQGLDVTKANSEPGAPTSLAAERVRRGLAGDWSISRSWAIEPPTGAECDAAYLVRLTDTAGNEHDLVVEFAAPSVLTSVGYAEEIARPFRQDGAPPSHVIVDLEGNVRAAGDAHDPDGR